MRFSLLALTAALTAFMSVSATQPTPAVFSGGCTLNGGTCTKDSQCCSKVCLTAGAPEEYAIRVCVELSSSFYQG
ncbi:hypothetical protein BDR03DRAFT_974593 [Suillus americanus]|nr:hypothetical protein BDR03DRAFT_974593 [Suillus americanus]